MFNLLSILDYKNEKNHKLIKAKISNNLPFFGFFYTRFYLLNHLLPELYSLYYLCPMTYKNQNEVL